MSKGKIFTDIIPFFKNSKEILEIFVNRMKDQKKGKKLEPIEFKVIQPDGKEIWIYWQSSTIRVSNKELIQAIVIDITERKKAEQLIIEEYEKLQELNEMKQELITRISHELKTPITSVYGATQAILELYKTNVDEEILDLVELVNRGGVRLKNLVDNLLDIIEFDSKQLKLTYQEKDLVKIIRDCVNELKGIANDRKIIIDLNLPGNCLLKLDNKRIRQVITNIVSNAINNTLPEGSVHIDLIETGDYIDVRVKDTGIGITDEEKERLFTKFGKIERYGKGYDVHIDGPGLGLYISKEIVENLGGKILIESEGRNKGATFIVRLVKE